MPFRGKLQQPKMLKQQQAARKRARHGAGGDDDDERVVYYDLDAGSQPRNPLLYSPELTSRNARSTAHSKSRSRNGSASHRASSTAAGKRATAKASGRILERPKEIFHQQSLFQLDASGGEDDGNESEDENPFASLLQQPKRTHRAVGAYEEEDGDDCFDHAIQTAAMSASQSSTAAATAMKKPQSKSIARKTTSPVRVTPPRRSSSVIVSPGELATGRSSTRREKSVMPAVVAGISKRLSVEAADARPSRWSRKSTAVAKKGTDRRRSVPNALQKKRQAQTGSRRTSLPLSLVMESQQPTQDDPSQSDPKKRRLADVLMRATLLSQQKTQDERPSQHDSQSRESSFAIDNDDAIADTEHQMREEKFETQIFSPSKLHANSSAAASRKKQQKADAAATKIRGELGEVIARAIRKSNRDLTMLHSHGQTLVEQTRDASGYGVPGGLDRVQNRDFTLIRLRSQLRQSSGDQQTVYDGTVQELSPGVQTPCKEEKARVRVAFSSRTAAQLSLEPNALVKIYAPFHFIPFEQAAGSSSVKRKKNKWLLVGTALSEIV